MISLKRLRKSFHYAFKGLKQVWQTEQNFRIQIVLGLIAIIIGVILKITTLEMSILLLAIVIVLVLELVNTIFEKLTDIVRPRLHAYVQTIKDIMAAAVLVSSIGALLTGLLIFWPYIA